MTEHLDRFGLQIATPLVGFIETRALPGTGIEPGAFWTGAAAIFARFAPENRDLLARRDALQAAIDTFHAERRGRTPDDAEYQALLRGIGYLVPEPAPFTIGTGSVDAEISSLTGPQLVVPVLNDRFVLNAANAR